MTAPHSVSTSIAASPSFSSQRRWLHPTRLYHQTFPSPAVASVSWAAPLAPLTTVRRFFETGLLRGGFPWWLCGAWATPNWRLPSCARALPSPRFPFAPINVSRHHPLPGEVRQSRGFDLIRIQLPHPPGKIQIQIPSSYTGIHGE